MFKKIGAVILHPSNLFRYIGYILKRARLSRVVISDKIFYKYEGELYPDYLNDGNASSFISAIALKWCAGKGLDIGAGDWPLSGSIPIRNEQGRNAYNLDAFDDASLDFVFSSHCLEHLDPWQTALRLWISKLRLNGILFLYVPHESMKLWNPWGAWVASGHKWKPTVEILLPFLRDNGIEIIDYNGGRDDYWSFHVVGKRRAS